MSITVMRHIEDLWRCQWRVVLKGSSSSIIWAALSPCCCRTTVQCQQNQFVAMVIDQHWATGAQIKHSTSSDRIREWRPEQNGFQFSAEDGKRGAFRMCCSRAFQARAAPIGNDRSPKVERRVDWVSLTGRLDGPT